MKILNSLGLLVLVSSAAMASPAIDCYKQAMSDAAVLTKVKAQNQQADTQWASEQNAIILCAGPAAR